MDEPRKLGSIPPGVLADMMRVQHRTRLTSGQAFLCYFTKKDGTVRRLVGIYQGARARRKNHIIVFDTFKMGCRTIDLNAVQSVRLLSIDQETAPTP